MLFNLANRDEVKTYGKAIRVRLIKAAFSAATTFYNSVVPGYMHGDPWNPMFTGYFRANWNISIDTPDLSVVGVREPREPDDSYHKFLGDINPKAASQLLGTPDAVAKFAKSKNKVIYVTNNTWYADWLEKGGSSLEDYGYETFLGKCMGNFLLQSSSEFALNRVHGFFNRQRQITRAEANQLPD